MASIGTADESPTKPIFAPPSRSPFPHLEVIGLLSFIVLILILILVVSPKNPHDSSEGQKYSHVDDAQGQLLQVIAVYRHGDRTPIMLYETDPYKNYSWPDGLGGELTNQGKERMWHLAKFYRNRYEHFLDKLPPNSIKSQSSPYARCLMSSQVLLAGLYPPRDEQQVWSSCTPLASHWQPMATLSTSIAHSHLLNPTAPCPKAQKLESLALTHPSVQRYVKENGAFISEVSKYTGHNFTSINWPYIVLIHDTLLAEKYYFGDNFKEPEWLSAIGNDTFARLTNLATLVFDTFRQSAESLRLRTGTLINEMLNSLNASAVQSKPQMFTYATHDLMIAYILSAMGLYKEMPNYSSGFIVELRLLENIPHVRLLYSNATRTPVDIVELPLNESSTFAPYCTNATYCTLENFTRALKQYRVSNIEKECTLSQGTTVPY